MRPGIKIIKVGRDCGKSVEKVLNVRRMNFNGGAHWGKYKQIHVERRMGMNEMEIGRGEARRGEGDSCVPSGPERA